jgi:DNA-binding MurR/RpiR family transcriptional regulator
MAMTAAGPLDLAARAAGSRLTPAQRRVLGYLVEHAREIPFCSAHDLALRAGVSQPSVTRLARVLGFDGYGALREAVGRSVLAPTAPGDHGADRWRAAARAEADDLRRLGERLPSDETWREIGCALAASSPLVVVGLRASGYLAHYLAYLARKVHAHVVEVATGGAEALDTLHRARDAGGTVAVVVCLPRYPAETVTLLGELDRLGYRIALVSDDLMPPVPGVIPTWRLAVPVRSGLTFDSHPAALALLTMVLEALCDAIGPRAEESLERLDALAEEAGTYWSG